MDVQTAVFGHPFYACAALAGAVAIFGIAHDYRHSRRSDLDKVSLISWGMVSSIALIVAIVCFAMGLRSGG